ncbi:hypothetical protein MTX80_23195 (plasmid) [Gordonia amicalis]|nr:hypothetical protein [Gordonia amicalis]UOG23825.1 hypothetical protein MTX80_23195 [Gordonia amicalis]
MTDMDRFATDDFDRELEQLQTTNGTPNRSRNIKIPAGQKFTSVIGLGPIPWTKIVKTCATVAEYNRLDNLPAREDLTLMEQVVRSPQIARAEGGLEKAARGPIAGRIGSIKKIFAQINMIDAMIVLLTGRPMIGPDGEQLTPAAAADKHQQLLEVIDGHRVNGSTKHTTDRTRRKGIETGLVALDFPLFLLAMIGLLNVNIILAFSGNSGHIWKLTTAVLFAVFGTLLYAYLNRATGRRHRRHKTLASTLDHTGTVGRRIIAEQIALGAITVFVVLVMGIRIYLEGLAAEAPFALAITLAVLFGLLIGYSGYLNYMAEYENGSEETEQLRHLSGQLTHRADHIESLNTQREELVENAGIQIAALIRDILDAEEHALRTVTASTADRAIILARSYHALSARIPAPSFDAKMFALTVEQAGDLTEHHKILRTTSHFPTD